MSANQKAQLWLFSILAVTCLGIAFVLMGGCP